MNANYGPYTGGYNVGDLDPFGEDDYERMVREELERQRAVRAPVFEQPTPRGPALNNFFASLAGTPASTLNPNEADAAQRAALGAMSDKLLRFVQNGGWYSSTIADMNAARRGAMSAAEQQAQARRAAMAESELQAQTAANKAGDAGVERANFFERAGAAREDQAYQVKTRQREETEYGATAEATAALVDEALALPGLSKADKAVLEAARRYPADLGGKIATGVIEAHQRREQQLRDEAEAERRQVERDKVNFAQQQALLNQRPDGGGTSRGVDLTGFLEDPAEKREAEMTIDATGAPSEVKDAMALAARRLVQDGKAPDFLTAIRMVASKAPGAR